MTDQELDKLLEAIYRSARAASPLSYLPLWGTHNARAELRDIIRKWLDQQKTTE